MPKPRLLHTDVTGEGWGCEMQHNSRVCGWATLRRTNAEGWFDYVCDEHATAPFIGHHTEDGRFRETLPIGDGTREEDFEWCAVREAGDCTSCGRDTHHIRFYTSGRRKATRADFQHDYRIEVKGRWIRGVSGTRIGEYTCEDCKYKPFAVYPLPDSEFPLK